MTLQSVVRDKLILIASSRVSPVAPVLDCLSDPARSTMLNFPTQMWAYPSAPREHDSMVIVKIEWDHEEVLFI